MSILEQIKRFFQKEEVPPPEIKLPTLYDCYNCGAQRKDLHKCDICHGFFCFPCLSSHDCKVAQRQTPIAIDKDYRDGVRAVAQRPPGNEFEDGLKAMMICLDIWCA